MKDGDIIADWPFGASKTNSKPTFLCELLVLDRFKSKTSSIDSDIIPEDIISDIVEERCVDVTICFSNFDVRNLVHDESSDEEESDDEYGKGKKKFRKHKRTKRYGIESVLVSLLRKIGNQPYLMIDFRFSYLFVNDFSSFNSCFGRYKQSKLVKSIKLINLSNNDKFKIDKLSFDQIGRFLSIFDNLQHVAICNYFGMFKWKKPKEYRLSIARYCRHPLRIDGILVKQQEIPLVDTSFYMLEESELNFLDEFTEKFFSDAAQLNLHQDFLFQIAKISYERKDATRNHFDKYLSHVESKLILTGLSDLPIHFVTKQKLTDELHDHWQAFTPLQFIVFDKMNLEEKNLDIYKGMLFGCFEIVEVFENFDSKNKYGKNKYKSDVEKERVYTSSFALEIAVDSTTKEIVMVACVVLPEFYLFFHDMLFNMHNNNLDILSAYETIEKST
eukprot:TRINITY_DN6941_c0_g1_i1.p1 TRINITY_DN6941_c0_g1~~TRINITY_DN6941_c0_g1_i1.p1  ORF type:complete len:445 (+),score=124.76 TRINITY_DN6941_c0_g1_i1:44-1378(+)